MKLFYILWLFVGFDGQYLRKAETLKFNAITLAHTFAKFICLFYFCGTVQSHHQPEVKNYFAFRILFLPFPINF